MQQTSPAGAEPASQTEELLKDLLFGLLLLAVGIFALVWIKFTPAAISAPAAALDFASVPVLCSLLLIFLSAIYAGGALLNLILLDGAEARQWPSPLSWRPTIVTWRRLATAVGLIGYAFALKALPFFFATFMLLAVMFFVYGRRSIIMVGIVSLLGSAALTGLFVYALRLPI